MKTILSEQMLATVAQATNYSVLKETAISSIQQLAENCPDIYQVCGPISTGGKNDVQLNLAMFDEAITCLIDLGICVFDQTPYEQPMQRIKEIRQANVDRYDTTLLTDFYQPIFQDGHIKTLIFLPGWRDSVGSCWEFMQAHIFGMRVLAFNDNWLTTYQSGERDIAQLSDAVDDKIEDIMKRYFDIHPTKKIALIMAIAENGVVGNSDPEKKAIPWLGQLRTDMNYFKTQTIGDNQNAVAMGRVTWNTIPSKYRPFKGRYNMVISRSHQNTLSEEGVFQANSVESVLQHFASSPHKTLWITGGPQIYDLFMPYAHELHITRVHADIDGEVVYEPSLDEWHLFSQCPQKADDHNIYPFTFYVYDRQ